jgi:hypothetical protein
MRRKTVYLNGVPVGSAATWHEVAALLTELLRRPISSREAQKMGSEGPDGSTSGPNAELLRIGIRRPDPRLEFRSKSRLQIGVS